MIEDLVKALSKREEIFDRSQDAHARELKANQKLYWNAVSTAHIGVLNHYRTASGAVEELKLIFSLIESHIDQCVRIEKYADQHVVVSRLPLITSESGLYSYAQNHPFLTAAALFSELSPLILEGVFGDENRQFTALGSGCFSALGSRYEIERASTGRETPELMEKLRSDAVKIIDKLESCSATYEGKFEEIARSQQALSSGFEESTGTALSRFEHEASEKVAAYLNAQKELEKIRRPVALWSQNARRHRIAFRVGLAGLLIIVVLSAVGLFACLPSLLDRLGFIKAGGAEQFTPASTLTLAAFIALVAAAGFVLKIGGRFVTNALTLAEDAEVRSALADTFIGLTAEDLSSSEGARNQARTVMLAALFRPLPGHQQEEITAPTVLSLAQDMLGKKTSSG